MLIVSTILIGILTIVLAVHGGILTSSEPKHRWWFIGYGIFGVLLVCVQGYFLATESAHNSAETSQLRREVDQLRDQGITLLNTIRLQATLDDLRGIQVAISAGFAHMEEVIKGSKKTAVVKPPMPPAQVQHIRFTQLRTASDRQDAKYGIQVIIQTDITIQPVGFMVICDSHIVDSKFFIVGESMYMQMATRYSADRKTFSFSFHSPPFSPTSALVVTLLSNEDIRASRVEQIQPLF